MKIFFEVLEKRINFSFKKDWRFYSIKDDFEKLKIEPEEPIINFLKSNFEKLKTILLSEDLDLLGEEKLFLNGIIYPGNVNRLKIDDYFWIQNRNNLIIFDLNKDNFDEKLFIINCHIHCMADITIETTVFDSNVKKIVDCKPEKQSIKEIIFFSSYINEVCNSEISFLGKEEIFFLEWMVQNILPSNDYRKIESIIGNSSVRAGERTEIHVVTDFVDVITSGHIDIARGSARVTLVNKGEILTIAEKAIVLTKGSQSAACLGDSILISFQEGAEPKKPTEFYHGWYVKERIIQSTRMGNCRIID